MKRWEYATHVPACRWERTTPSQCEFRETHNFCPHPEHACSCPPAPARLGGREVMREELFCNDANVPVDIWIEPEGDRFSFTWSFYMPRKGRLTDPIKEHALTREEITAYLKERVIPLYRTAVEQLEAMAEGKADHLYYWALTRAKDEDAL